jgi:pantoate--beta-alanine ligase
MIVLPTLAELEAEARRRERPEGLGGVLVPTMGALHRGHAALIARGAALAREHGSEDGCTVSIFVNPTQFNDPEDFRRYPRTLEQDLEISRAAGAEAVFVPDVDSMYPPGVPIPVPPLPEVAVRPGLENAFRPGHFAGVCQVVLRLFRLLQPRAAVFGEKDWQQLRVIAAMTVGAGLAVEIVPHETLRESDGLAMSSRNRFLSAEDRERAGAIFRALERSRGGDTPAAAEALMTEELRSAGIEAEYAVVRDAETLLGSRPGRPGRALIAAPLGGVRLIDNAEWLPRARQPVAG